jgi:serine/threonine protein kinase
MLRIDQLLETAYYQYKVTGGCGEGGAAHVFKVERNDGEIFAVKILKKDNCVGEKLKRYKNEISFSIKSNHPNIIVLNDSGFVNVDNVKCPFYIMPYHEKTLRKLMDSTLDGEKVLKYLENILDGLEYAHKKKTWHRDLKPENILYDANEDKVIIADFGIAHISEELAETEVETRMATRLANFQYHSPEQKLRNNNHNITHLTDIYSLGLILNEMFTGTIIQGTGFTTIQDVSSEYDFLDDIVDKMVKQNPAQRISSITELKELIWPDRKVLVDDPVHKLPLNALIANVVPVQNKQRSEELKSYLVDPLKVIQLSDFVSTSTEKLTSLLKGEEFDVYKPALTSQTLEERIQKYDYYSSELCNYFAIGSYWINDNSFDVWKRSLERISNYYTDQNGLVVYLKLRQYAAIRLFYIAGISCVAKQNYKMLKRFFYEVNILKKNGEKDGVFALAGTNILSQDAGRLLPGYEKRHTPLSDYLLKTLRPFFQSLIPDDEEFEEQFLMFEYLFCLAYSANNYEEGAKFIWNPGGRFVWKDSSYNQHLPKRIDQAVSREGASWAPFAAGVFKVNFETFEKVKKKADMFYRELNWW